ncbi:MAG TPA: hypothetical protein VHQ48_10770 [Bradyrhizobium sp.]|nr:hypothetical protein [Bradyrhizobium sp.]
MLPDRLIYLPGIGHAPQRRPAFAGGNALLKLTQIGYEICPKRKGNHKNEQEQESYSYARFRIRI